MKTPFVDIHTHHACPPDVVCLRSWAPGRDAGPPPGGMVSVGVHPWDAAKADTDSAVRFLENGDFAAVGEIGLDFAAGPDRDVQERVFRLQLEIAQRCGKPVVMHCVRAYNEVLAILKEYRLPAAIFHGYTGSPQQTAAIVARGCYLSFGPVSLGSPKTVESLREVPAGLLFVETDDSGEDIAETYRRVAGARGETVEELRRSVYSNYEKVFG